jgi:hypothetical protein
MTHSFQQHHLTSDKRSQEVCCGQPPQFFYFIYKIKSILLVTNPVGEQVRLEQILFDNGISFVSYVCFTMVSLIFCVIKCLPKIIFLCDASPLIAVVPQQSCQTFLGRLREWNSLRCCWFGTDTWRVCLTIKDGSFWCFTIRLKLLDNHSRHTVYLLSPSLKGPRYFGKRSF